jgi:hypothetical protein
MKNKLVLLAMALAFSLIFINCGENPEEKKEHGNEEDVVTYTGGSDGTATVITITTAADGTKTYVIEFGGERISSGSVVIDENGTMTFTPEDEGEIFTAETTGDGAVPSFTGQIPIAGGGTVNIPALVKQFAVVDMQVYLYDGDGDRESDGKTGGSYNVVYSDSDEEVIGEINKVSIGTVGTVTGGKISVTLTSLEDSQLGTFGEDLKWATTTTSGLKAGNLELRRGQSHTFGLTNPRTEAMIVYFNRDGEITFESKTLQVKRGWNFLTPTDKGISQNIQDVYNKEYKWIYYNEITVTYTGSSGNTAIVITITTPAARTSTYVIMYGGDEISKGSVVINDSTMTFTSDGEKTFTAKTSSGEDVLSFTEQIPIAGGGTVNIPALVKQSTLSFAVVDMQVYLFDSVGDGIGDGKKSGGSYNVPDTGTDEEVIGEINNKVSIGKVGTITGGKISVTLTSLKDSQLDTLDKVWQSATTTTSGLKAGMLELRRGQSHYFGLSHPQTGATIVYFNKDGNITVGGKILQVKRGWNFLFSTDIEVSQNIQDVYTKGYKWIYYNINHND